VVPSSAPLDVSGRSPRSWHGAAAVLL